MKKLFISQPMKDKTDEEILQERERAIARAKVILGEEVELIDSFFQDVPHDAKPLWYLAKSLELLSTADIAFFAPDWWNYRGCKIEYDCAVAYGIPHIDAIYNKSFDFGGALKALKAGNKVAHRGWNGKGMFVFESPKLGCQMYEQYTGNSINDINEFFLIKNVNNTLSTWVPSINDCLAEDWIIIE